MTANPYDESLSVIRESTENLAAWLAIWEGRGRARHARPPLCG